MNTLTLLKWKDEQGHVKMFKLITKVSSKWRDFGIRLNHNVDKLDAWANQFRGVSSMCWCKVMSDWITRDDSPYYPATWSGLLLMLEDVEYSEVATALKKALDSVIPTAGGAAKSSKLLSLSIPYAPDIDTTGQCFITRGKHLFATKYQGPSPGLSPQVRPIDVYRHSSHALVISSQRYFENQYCSCV